MGDLIQGGHAQVVSEFLKPILNSILTDAITETHIIRLINSECKKGEDGLTGAAGVCVSSDNARLLTSKAQARCRLSVLK